MITQRAIKRNARKTKVCTKCQKRKPNTSEHFGRRYQAGVLSASLDSWCRTCRRLQCREWTAANKDKLNVSRKKTRDARRLSLLTHYCDGNPPACQCCGEDEIKFLALDHIKGNGHRHRLEVGRGGTFYIWLEKQGRPPGFRVLCHNCNLAIGLYGACPHQVKRL